jgi:phosphoribosylformylglycinamidine (FGAM) synthase PurS component
MVKNIKRYQRELHKDSTDAERRVPEMVTQPLTNSSIRTPWYTSTSG